LSHLNTRKCSVPRLSWTRLQTEATSCSETSADVKQSIRHDVSEDLKFKYSIFSRKTLLFQYKDHLSVLIWKT